MGTCFSKRLAETVFVAVLLVSSGCTGLGRPVTAEGQGDMKEIHLTASSYEFKPNNIKVPEPGSLTLIIENISGAGHNITVENPEGEVLKSVDLPAKKTTSVTVDLPSPGNYEFYCDIGLHATLGMKGRIQVGP